MIKDKEVTIDLVHVYDIPVSTATSIPQKAINGMLEEKKAATIRRLVEYRDQLKNFQQGKIYPVFGVYPSTEIAEISDKINSDLIVTGLRQKYSMLDRMIGTVTAHTILKSSTPVLAIPNGAKYKPIKDVLFPTEMNIDDKLSSVDIEALERLFYFCEIIDSPKVHMIHISTEASSKAIDLIFNNHPLKSMDFTLASAQSVDDGILAHIEKRSIDLMAMYKPHRNLWERIYHSSVTRKMLYQSRLPLLIFS